MKTREGCFNEGIDEEMGNTVDTVEERIRRAIFKANDDFITSQIKLAVRWKNATGVTANSECGEGAGIAASFEKLC